jgi:site-specific recombinase XerD
MANSVNIWRDGKTGQIYLHVNYFGNRLKVATGIFVKDQDWSRRQRRVKARHPKSAHYNRALALFAERAEETMLEARVAAKSLTKAGLQQACFGVRTNNVSVYEATQMRISAMRHRLSKGAIENLHKAAQVIEQYRPGITIDAITAAEGERLTRWLVEQGYQNSTINSILNRLRAVCNYAFEAGIAEAGVAKNLRGMKEASGGEAALTHDELLQLMRYRQGVEERGAGLSLDYFLLCCMTSMRISEAQAIVPGSLGDHRVEVYASKDAEVQVKYCPPPAVVMLEGYSGSLPHRAQQVVNRELKQLASAAGLTRTFTQERRSGSKTSVQRRRVCDAISTHWGRRTFVTLMLEAGFQRENLMKLTGHKSVEMLQRYNRAAFGQITEIADKLWR